jgi:hypothetical protein
MATREGKRVTPEEALEAMRDGCDVACRGSCYFANDKHVVDAAGDTWSHASWLEQSSDVERLYVVYDPRHEELDANNKSPRSPEGEGGQG